MFLVWLVIGAALFLVVMEGCVRLCVTGYGYIFHEFPVFDSILLNKFTSYDAELGWEPQPGDARPAVGELRPDTTVSQKDARRKAKSYYAINADGSRKQPPASKPLVGPYIELFGDSACMCRDVDDDETFPFFLEENHQLGPCKNFGSGNYGSDQAVLRANRRMKGGGVAILFVTVKSLGRNAAVYKHYSEPGNYWAIKPRFKIKEGGLELISRPFVEREELANLTFYKEHFHSHDDHYRKFLSYTPIGKKSYFLHFLKNDYTRDVLWKRIRRDSEHRFLRQLAEYMRRADNKLCRLFPFLSGNSESFARVASGDDGELFALIARRFSNLAASRGSSAMVVLTPQGEGMQGPNDYRLCAKALTRWCNKHGVTLYDFGEALLDLGQATLQDYKAYSNHLSREGNKFLAEWLATKIGCHIQGNNNA